MKSLEDRFWAKVRKTDTCWEWTAATQRGYGAFSIGAGKLTRAHRYSYEALVAPIPDGLVIDHLCRNRRCVNPAHMEVVTRGENAGRGQRLLAADRTHCKRGHAYVPGNFRYERGNKGRPTRRCLVCQRLAHVARSRG